jgi:hypothetical protein
LVVLVEPLVMELPVVEAFEVLVVVALVVVVVVLVELLVMEPLVVEVAELLVVVARVVVVLVDPLVGI